MSIVRTAEFLLNPDVLNAKSRFENVLSNLDIQIESTSETNIKASTARAIRKNRWASNITIDFLNDSGTQLVRISVDMQGTKHYEIIDEILEPLRDLIDDRGLIDAVNKLGKAGSTFAKLEIRMLPSLLRGRERVLGIASGTHNKKLCAICLTTERMLFVDKGLLATQLDVSEVPISSITRVSTRRSMTGEGIEIATAGSVLLVERVMHGQAEELSRRLHEAQTIQRNGSTPSNSPLAKESPLDALKKLSELHDAGVLTDEEFAAKKLKLMDQI